MRQHKPLLARITDEKPTYQDSTSGQASKSGYLFAIPLLELRRLTR